MKDRFALLLMVVAFTTSDTNAQSKSAPAAMYFPTASQWETISPDVAGADREQLERALQYAGEKNSKGVVVLWRGRILAERYWDGCTQATTHPAYSASKSIVSTLVGMAIEDKKIAGTGRSAAVFLREWQGQPTYEAITIGHMLSMTSGLEGGKRNFLQDVMPRDERAFATSLPLEFPGYSLGISKLRLPFVLFVATGSDRRIAAEIHVQKAA